MMKPPLILVYQADHGWWPALMSTAHKLLSPATYGCSLCALTHGLIGEQVAWRAFIARHGERLTILHRDQFRAQYPANQLELPRVFRGRADQTLETVLDPAAIREFATVDELIVRLESLL